MDNETIFFIIGPLLAVSAVVVSFLGLRLDSFPGRFAPLVFVWFAILVVGATTFGVLHSQDEEQANASELATAGQKAEEEEASPVSGSKSEGSGGKSEGGGEAKSQAGAKGPGGTLQLAADPSAIAFDKNSLTSKPGKVTIDFDNPAPLEHDVAIEQGGKVIAVSQKITEGKTSVSADLAPGTYTFLCTVPGHAEAGMEGVLTVR
ncbi:MAG TPA: plastocyanin/azurin family copper-binding protein [Solirubrobacterales bacterium]|nr:plastocyanin/azurin family copper-binding protein [Solirubrobacterales bacterium]